ncbi:hypothetical protein [Streptomyces sp. NRRL S-1813]|uniref:hypothetical protein n=1 Tax=Streptomyces sp. NRRL S-1813 TaxID=1463888 RepID=UPI00131A91EC|nr:hypothetical protein [Streptomyces sp. NRRL S-1813]
MADMKGKAFRGISVCLASQILTVGCSTMKSDASGLEYEPEKRDSQQVAHEAEDQEA